MSKCKLRDLHPNTLRGCTVLVRTDYNVPCTMEDGRPIISNDARIRSSLETLQFLVDSGAKVVVCSHLGRPKGPDNAFSLRPVAKHLQEISGFRVSFVDDCIGESVEKAKRDLTEGSILLLENLRFRSGELENDKRFAAQLCSGIDIYVNDAFAASHRGHASLSAVAEFVRRRYCGVALEKELHFLRGVMDSPRRPVGAVIGGLKVSTKVHLLRSLLDKADKLLIGGAMMFTFFKAMGHDVGDSFVEESAIETAKDIIRLASDGNCVLRFALDIEVIPTRAFLAKHPKKLSSAQPADVAMMEYSLLNVSFSDIRPHWSGVDIGPQSVADFTNELESCHTIVLNGPMGMFEVAEFAFGTREILKILERRTAAGCTTIICGGETVAAAAQFGCKNFSHISMGGGAALELLSGAELPGVAILNDE